MSNSKNHKEIEIAEIDFFPTKKIKQAIASVKESIVSSFTRLKKSMPTSINDLSMIPGKADGVLEGLFGVNYKAPKEIFSSIVHTFLYPTRILLFKIDEGYQFKFSHLMPSVPAKAGEMAGEFAEKAGAEIGARASELADDYLKNANDVDSSTKATILSVRSFGVTLYAWIPSKEKTVSAVENIITFLMKNTVKDLRMLYRSIAFVGAMMVISLYPELSFIAASVVAASSAYLKCSQYFFSEKEPENSNRLGRVATWLLKSTLAGTAVGTLVGFSYAPQTAGLLTLLGTTTAVISGVAATFMAIDAFSRSDFAKNYLSFLAREQSDELLTKMYNNKSQIGYAISATYTGQILYRLANVFVSLASNGLYGSAYGLAFGLVISAADSELGRWTISKGVEWGLWSGQKSANALVATYTAGHSFYTNPLQASKDYIATPAYNGVAYAGSAAYTYGIEAPGAWVASTTQNQYKRFNEYLEAKDAPNEMELLPLKHLLRYITGRNMSLEGGQSR